MIFPIKDMRIFAPEELGLLIGNADEDWSRESESQLPGEAQRPVS
jgi:E3 ubiquitin-protein ligase TRIP12